MNELANASVELVIWVLRLAFVGLVYLFVWRLFKAIIRGDQNLPAFTGTSVFLVIQRPGTTLLQRNKVYEVYDNTVIGRSTDCTIQIPDKLVSERHCVLSSQDGGWYIRDLGSTNHTYINQLQVVTPVELEDGDVITVGQVELRLHINDTGTA